MSEIERRLKRLEELHAKEQLAKKNVRCVPILEMAWRPSFDRMFTVVQTKAGERLVLTFGEKRALEQEGRDLATLTLKDLEKWQQDRSGQDKTTVAG